MTNISITRFVTDMPLALEELFGAVSDSSFVTSFVLPHSFLQNTMSPPSSRMLHMAFVMPSSCPHRCPPPTFLTIPCTKPKPRPRPVCCVPPESAGSCQRPRSLIAVFALSRCPVHTRRPRFPANTKCIDVVCLRL